MTTESKITFPCYLGLAESGQLQKRVERALEFLSPCKVCPRHCQVDRFSDEKGVCSSGRLAMVSSYGPHFGEERPLVGRYGSGTIFLTNCNLKCIFCQNYDISQLGRGSEVSASQLAAIMLRVQDMGCHNINFVTPTHFVPQILEALVVAIEKGLRLALVYNCGGYESLEMLKLLDGVVDIYMPDAKYAQPEVAQRFSKAPDYPEVMREALKEMHRQVGDLELDSSGIARRGLLVRHLVLPEDLAGTEAIMRFISEEISRDTYVNVMAQYRPCHRAYEFPELSRSPTIVEYRRAVEKTLASGLHRLD